MLRTGVDLVDIERIRSMAETGGPVFVDSTWTQEEQSYCAGSADRLAARWGAKEAVMKALGTGFPDIEHLDIEVVSSQGVAPILRLSGDAARRAAGLRLTDWSLSLSHDAGFAIALVVASGDVA
jgi:holo-[acyl-carrier protein] synthase